MATTACAARLASGIHRFIFKGVLEENRRGRDKRFTHHHSQQHIRPQQKAGEKQRKLREKRRTSDANFISTDGTVSFTFILTPIF